MDELLTEERRGEMEEEEHKITCCPRCYELKVVNPLMVFGGKIYCKDKHSWSYDEWYEEFGKEERRS